MNDLDTQIRERLHSATADVLPEPAFAATVLHRGRTRRMRRYAVVAASVAALGTGTALVLPEGNPVAREGQVAAGGTPQTYDAALRWARGLPEGPTARLPFFGEGGVHDGDRVVAVPDAVNRSIQPERVTGGWVVVVGHSERQLEPAVLGEDGSLTALPPFTYTGGVMDPTIMPSPDGARVAYGDRVLELGTLHTTELPHNPAHERDADPDYATSLRLFGWTDEGLLYEGAPTEKGMGTTWLLRADGSTTKVTDPGDPRHAAGAGVADVALTHDYSEKGNTCTTSHRLVDGAWVEEATGCYGLELEEAVDVSPDGRWLLTDDLPQVWDLQEGRWASVDVPRALVEAWGEDWFVRVGWESVDTFLIPVADTWLGWEPPAEPVEWVEQHVQVVRCSMATGACERAGAEQTIRFDTDSDVDPMFGAAQVHFHRH